MYGERLPDPPERFLGELDGGTAGKRKKKRWGPRHALDLALRNHPAAYGAVLGAFGVVVLVLRLVARRRRRRG